MMRINLLPPEIIERRKYERFYPYIFIALAIAVFVVVGIWATLQIINAARVTELQSIEQTAADLNKQAESLAVFELKEQDIASRQAAVTSALQGRIDMGRVAEEVSLVLPEEVWLTQFELHAPPADAPEGATDLRERLLGWVPRPEGTTTSDGYKSVASTLVRLASLEDSFEDVWLRQASTSSFTAFQGQSTQTPNVPGVSFEIESQLKPVDAPVVQ